MCKCELTEFLAELTEFAAELSEFSPPKQYSRNSIPPDSYCQSTTTFRAAIACQYSVGVLRCGVIVLSSRLPRKCRYPCDPDCLVQPTNSWMWEGKKGSICYFRVSLVLQCFGGPKISRCWEKQHEKCHCHTLFRMPQVLIKTRT